MSAAQIIEQIKALPVNEQVKVREFVQELASTGAHPVSYIDREEAREIAGRIFEENAELFRKLAE